MAFDNNLSLEAEAIKSAFDVNRPDKIYFVCAYEPQTEWFEKSKPYIKIVKIFVKTLVE